MNLIPNNSFLFLACVTDAHAPCLGGNKLRAWRSGLWFQPGARDISVLQNALFDCGPNHTPVYWATFDWGLGTNGAIPALSLCAFVTGTGATLRDYEQQTGYDVLTADTSVLQLFAWGGLTSAHLSRHDLQTWVNYAKHQTKETRFAQCRQTVVSGEQQSKQPRSPPPGSDLWHGPVLQAVKQVPGVSPSLSCVYVKTC